MWTALAALSTLLLYWIHSTEAITLLLRVEEENTSIDNPLTFADGVLYTSMTHAMPWAADTPLQGTCSTQPFQLVLDLRGVGVLLIAVGILMLLLVAALFSAVVVPWTLHSKGMRERRDTGRPKRTSCSMPRPNIPNNDHKSAGTIVEDSQKENPGWTALGPRKCTNDPPYVVLAPGVTVEKMKVTTALFDSCSHLLRAASELGSTFDSFVGEDILLEDTAALKDPAPSVSPFEDPSKWPNAKFPPCSRTMPAGPPSIYNIHVDLVHGGWTKEGGCGIVKEGIYNDGRMRHRVVVKSSRLDAVSTQRETIKNEIMMLSSLPPHPNIVKLFGFSFGKKPYIVYEFLNMSLQELLQQVGKKRESLQSPYCDGLTYRQIINIMLDIVAGLKHLHDHDVVHMDVKEGNIMLDEDLRAKIIDFGSAQAKSPGCTRNGGQGTHGYLAPQRQHALEDRNDVYSLGRVMWNCLTAGYDEADIQRRLQVDIGCSCRCRTSILPEPLTRLIHCCWRYEQGRRPGLEQIRDCLHAFETEDWVDGRPIDDLMRAMDQP